MRLFCRSAIACGGGDMYRNIAIWLRNWATGKMVVASSSADHEQAATGSQSLANRLIPPLVAGGTLLTASLFKGYYMFWGSAQEGVVGMATLIGVILVCVEFLLALCLFSGLSKAFIRVATATIFTAFAIHSLRASLEGRPSCGCFGQLVTSPGVILIIDILVLILLFWWRTTPPVIAARTLEVVLCSSAGRHRLTPSRAILFLFFCLAFGTPAGWLSFQHSQPSMATVGRVFVVEPEQWLDKELPLVAHIDIGQELLKGDWIVLFYHYDCPRCQEAVARYEQDTVERDPAAPRVALVEVPPLEPEWSSSGNSICRRGRLDGSHDWFVATPTHLFLVDGVVREVSADALDTRSRKMSQSRSMLNQSGSL
jgi:endogenous inhibitor of DNA gyrase (YacG/DUF329 family)